MDNSQNTVGEIFKLPHFYYSKFARLQ